MANPKKGGSKVRSIVILCILLCVTIVLGVLGLNGMPLDGRGLYKLLPWLPTTDAANWPESLPLGLDLRGGVYVEYTATKPEDIEGDFGVLLDSTVSVIQQRLTDKGYAESTVQKINNNTGIRVEVPDVSNPQELLDLIGTPAELSFRDTDGNEFMTGRDVQIAVPQYDQQTNEYVVAFQLTPAGAQVFGEMTQKNVGKQLSIYLDNELITSPTVQEAITGGRGVINGMGTTPERAQTLAAQIQSGSLPLKLTQDKVDTVSATLGDEALSSSVLAAMIGILLVMLVMVLRYRMNGVVASWALVIYIIALFWLIAIIPGIQLTLPGLAGVVLGIGMAVDANVIIYERFNEEIRSGRAVRVAVRMGFKNALSAILDSNVTTLIAAIVLLYFGTGSVQGFAKTLLLGVIVSMFSAIVITRLLMTLFVGAGVDKASLYCSEKKAEDQGVQIKDHSKICLRVSCAIFAIALVLSIAGLGVNYGIDFAGGMSMQYDMGASVTQTDVEAALKEMGVESTVTVQGANHNEVNVRIKDVGTADVQNLQTTFEEKMITAYPNLKASGEINYVGPVAGKTLLTNAFLSVLIASALMLVYIAIRFDLSSGLAAVLGLIHDVLMMLAFMVLLRAFIQMNSTFIAAMLTIVGYSINNTIVIFDRIRENARRSPAGDRVEIVNRSVRECLGRTINTTLTTLITIVMLFILGVSSIREFALPIIIGILSGVYSANFINGYVWAFLEKKIRTRRAKKPAKA